ncbi:MAG TPA: DUF3106 domain-containing protein [Bryobacteraceae bacterium]
MRLTVAIPVVAALCLAGEADAQHANKPAAKPPAARPAPPPPAPRLQGPQENRPGSAEYMAKLLKLPEDQRNKALSGLPPARRTQIEQRLNDYLKKPADERARELEHLRRMQSLPPQKQNQVRASIRNLAALPQPRQKLVRVQINQLRPLSDADRRALMNTEEFRSRFTPSEQQMIEDISLVTPRTEVASR